MLHELFITQCTNSTLIMDPFIFIKDSYNHETLLEAQKNWRSSKYNLPNIELEGFLTSDAYQRKEDVKPCKSNGKTVSLNRP